MPDNKKRKVRVGAKMESSSIKRSEFENHAERDEKQKKNAQSFAIQSNDKARIHGFDRGLQCPPQV